MKNHYDRLFGVDLEAAQNSVEFYQTANGSVLCYDTVPSEFLKMIITLRDGSERFVQEEEYKKGGFDSQEKESIRPRRVKGNILAKHKTSNKRSWTAESNLWHSRDHQRKQKQRSVFTQCTYFDPKEADWEQFSANVEKS